MRFKWLEVCKFPPLILVHSGSHDKRFPSLEIWPRTIKRYFWICVLDMPVRSQIWLCDSNLIWSWAPTPCFAGKLNLSLGTPPHLIVALFLNFLLGHGDTLQSSMIWEEIYSGAHSVPLDELLWLCGPGPLLPLRYCYVLGDTNWFALLTRTTDFFFSLTESPSALGEISLTSNPLPSVHLGLFFPSGSIFPSILSFSNTTNPQG